MPADVLADAFGSLGEFASMEDYELSRMVLDSLKEYSLSEEDGKVFDKLKQYLAKMDWDGIKEVLESRKN